MCHQPADHQLPVGGGLAGHHQGGGEEDDGGPQEPRPVGPVCRQPEQHPGDGEDEDEGGPGQELVVQAQSGVVPGAGGPRCQAGLLLLPGGVIFICTLGKKGGK